jgi:hypothetical protein
MIEYQQYIDEKIHQLRIVSNVQWDYLNFKDLSNWLDDNFGNDLEGRFYGLKILLHTIYYSKKDLEKLLIYGLNEKIYGEKIKFDLIQNGNIYLSNSETETLVNNQKNLTLFIPLLDSDKPHESGNTLIGDLVHKLDVSEHQVDFHWNVDEDKLKNFKIVIFVDDCLGSGNQLRRFWNSKKIVELKSLFIKYEIEVYYLVLVGYDKSLIKLNERQNLKGIKVVICDILTEKNRIFSIDNIIWDNAEEMNRVITYFEGIAKERGINFFGYKNLDFAIILHDRLPNWSLPIFWKEMVGWKCLIRRKTTIK